MQHPDLPYDSYSKCSNEGAASVEIKVKGGTAQYRFLSNSESLGWPGNFSVEKPVFPELGHPSIWNATP